MSIKFGTTILFFLCTNLQRLAVGHECHRERQFVKVAPDGLPQISPLEVTTVTQGIFCSMKCLDYAGCNSFAYLNYTSTDNCLLSSSVDGVSVSGASGVVEIYKKSPAEVVKGCDPNPCLNGGTCLDTCEEPFYHCICPDSTGGAGTTGPNCMTMFVPFYARFTTLGATGRTGPTSIGNHYDGQSHVDLTNVQNGIQYFTVPYTGVYTIVAVGAAGGQDKSSTSYIGRGTKIGGDFQLQAGQILKILVGQRGADNRPYASCGGGGGSFVATSSNEPLIVGGGGGGIEVATTTHSNSLGSTSTSGNRNGGATGRTIWNGGAGGHGATEADTSNSGGGGGGFYSNGRSGTNFGGTSGFGGEGGYGFIQGGQGGRSYQHNAEGGFGGGGGSYGNAGGPGGGGGYSGGASGDNYYNTCGGGGGSYSSAFQNKHAQQGSNNGEGYVDITRLNV